MLLILTGRELFHRLSNFFSWETLRILCLCLTFWDYIKVCLNVGSIFLSMLLRNFGSFQHSEWLTFMIKFLQLTYSLGIAICIYSWASSSNRIVGIYFFRSNRNLVYCSVLNSTKVCLVKAMVFPGVMYGCESWTVKKAEHRRIDAFELWCWRRLLRVSWTARRSNQSILKEISPGIHWKDWCWSWNSNTSATWCEELTHSKSPWCWERLRAGREGTPEDDMVGWHHRLYGHEFK